MYKKMIKCPICGTKMEDEDFTECPYCAWGYTGIEEVSDPDEECSYNFMSINQAKKLVAGGKTIYGDPLPSLRVLLCCK